MSTNEDVQRYRANLQGEVDGVALYGALADAEPDPNLAAVYRKLASVEGAHAQFWRKHLDSQGVRGLKLSPEESPKLAPSKRKESWSERLSAIAELPDAASVDNEIARLFLAASGNG